MQVCNIFPYCTLTTIARSQLLHDAKKTSKTENEYTLIFICENKRRSVVQQSLRQKVFVAGEKNYPCYKTVIASIPQNIGFVQY